MKSHTLLLKELVKMRLALLLQLEILLLSVFLALSVAAVCIAWFTKSSRALRSPPREAKEDAFMPRRCSKQNGAPKKTRLTYVLIVVLIVLFGIFSWIFLTWDPRPWIPIEVVRSDPLSIAGTAIGIGVGVFALVALIMAAKTVPRPPDSDDKVTR
jgi:hypothetical protein